MLRRCCLCVRIPLFTLVPHVFKLLLCTKAVMRSTLLSKSFQGIVGLFMPHPWRHSRPGWVGPWAAWAGGGQPAHGRGWNWMTLKVLWTCQCLFRFINKYTNMQACNLDHNQMHSIILLSRLRLSIELKMQLNSNPRQCKPPFVVLLIGILYSAQEYVITSLFCRSLWCQNVPSAMSCSSDLAA